MDSYITLLPHANGVTRRLSAQGTVKVDGCIYDATRLPNMLRGDNVEVKADIFDASRVFVKGDGWVEAKAIGRLAKIVQESYDWNGREHLQARLTNTNSEYRTHPEHRRAFEAQISGLEKSLPLSCKVSEQTTEGSLEDPTQWDFEKGFKSEFMEPEPHSEGPRHVGH